MEILVLETIRHDKRADPLTPNAIRLTVEGEEEPFTYRVYKGFTEGGQGRWKELTKVTDLRKAQPVYQGAVTDLLYEQ